MCMSLVHGNWLGVSSIQEIWAVSSVLSLPCTCLSWSVPMLGERNSQLAGVSRGADFFPLELSICPAWFMSLHKHHVLAQRSRQEKRI